VEGDVVGSDQVAIAAREGESFDGKGVAAEGCGFG